MFSPKYVVALTRNRPGTVQVLVPFGAPAATAGTYVLFTVVPAQVLGGDAALREFHDGG